MESAKIQSYILKSEIKLLFIFLADHIINKKIVLATVDKK